MIPANVKDRTQTPTFCLSVKKFTKKDFHTQYEVFLKALFVKIDVFKTKLFKVDWSGSARLLREQRDR
ncbi:hypothetical protein BKC07_25745 [Peribacillus simplex]|nr:hypothetical protein BKC07_25745 [Peribacillus simplex]